MNRIPYVQFDAPTNESFVPKQKEAHNVFASVIDELNEGFKQLSSNNISLDGDFRPKAPWDCVAEKFAQFSRLAQMNNHQFTMSMPIGALNEEATVSVDAVNEEAKQFPNTISFGQNRHPNVPVNCVAKKEASCPRPTQNFQNNGQFTWPTGKLNESAQQFSSTISFGQNFRPNVPADCVAKKEALCSRPTQNFQNNGQFTWPTGKLNESEQQFSSPLSFGPNFRPNVPVDYVAKKEALCPWPTQNFQNNGQFTWPKGELNESTRQFSSTISFGQNLRPNVPVDCVAKKEALCSRPTQSFQTNDHLTRPTGELNESTQQLSSTISFGQNLRPNLPVDCVARNDALCSRPTQNSNVQFIRPMGELDEGAEQFSSTISFGQNFLENLPVDYVAKKEALCFRPTQNSHVQFTRPIDELNDRVKQFSSTISSGQNWRSNVPAGYVAKKEAVCSRPTQNSINLFTMPISELNKDFKHFSREISLGQDCRPECPGDCVAENSTPCSIVTRRSIIRPAKLTSSSCVSKQKESIIRPAKLTSSSCVSKQKEKVDDKESRKMTELKNREICMICREIFWTMEEKGFLPCTHAFHFRCLDRWLLAHNTCPVCKTIPTFPVLDTA